jgi:hypothetical protein
MSRFNNFASARAKQPESISHAPDTPATVDEGVHSKPMPAALLELLLIRG